MTPRDRAWLERIIECIAAIDAYVARTGLEWPADGMAVDAIAKRIEEIGEIAKRLGPDTLATMPGVDWRSVKGMREVIVHDYEDVEVDMLVEIVRDNLPDLLTTISRALAD